MSTNAAPSAAKWGAPGRIQKFHEGAANLAPRNGDVRLIACEVTRDGDIDAAVAGGVWAASSSPSA